MSRLQVAVDEFAREWLARAGEKPPQEEVLNGSFCAATGQPFCLCLRLGTELGTIIDFTGLTCAQSGKRVTSDSYEWMAEARRERSGHRA